ncbi:hypothetical protein A1359_03525 [Methylomonas lenta]|uniref:HTH luxR-type domain-containing protein n=1 Tax=Methylomonas lenta TaxID=980561 RepID=A0A177NQG5_9GAMM|nr:response regulator transcription factor [Methylomonas lenta]OAI20092.1 hypothetical protein A1359_03525 [Methylomonas lenta]
MDFVLVVSGGFLAVLDRKISFLCDSLDHIALIFHTRGGFVPIKLKILQYDTDIYNIESEMMAAHGVTATQIDPNNWADISADSPEIILLVSRTALTLLPCLKQLRGICPECKIIVGTECCTSLVLACLQLGVTGILCSQPAPAQLAEVIRLVLSGEYYLDNDIAQILAIRQIKKMLEPFTALSSREFDVFCMLAEGDSLQAIGEQLGISRKTVSNCQALLKLKLAVESRKEMLDFAKCHGLISHKKV